jgi:hypothetical protein
MPALSFFVRSARHNAAVTRFLRAYSDAAGRETPFLVTYFNCATKNKQSSARLRVLFSSLILRVHNMANRELREAEYRLIALYS